MTIQEFVESLPKESKVREMRERNWDLGLGPVRLQPGETRLVDIQPKCRFIAEEIRSGEVNAGVHLLTAFVGGKECLNLNGDSIDLGKSEIKLSIPWSDPALTISFEIVNRNREAREVWLDIVGRAVL